MIKLLMLSEAPVVAGSSRVLCYQYQPFLEEDGLSVDIFAPISSNLYSWLMKPRTGMQITTRVKRAILRLLYYFLILPINRIGQLMRAHRYDLVVVQRNLWYPGSPAIFERVLRRRVSLLVFNFDDALYIHWPDATRERIKLADAVWTGNEVLAEYARQFNSEVHIVESGVEIENHYLPKVNYALQTPPVIGWVGNPSNFKHLVFIEDVLLELMKKYDIRFRIICSRPYVPASSQLAIDFIPWSLEQEVENFLGLDIGIMPLQDDDYTRGKEGYKIKQYMACGIPSVASPVGYNTKLIKHGETGLLASSHQDWLNALISLISDSELRKKIGQNGRKYISENYATRTKARELKSWFEQLLSY